MTTSRSAATRALVLVLLLGGFILALLAWWGIRATLGGELRSIAECRRRYAGAHSLKDTATVDMLHPRIYREQASRPGSRTCGDLRLSGRLR